MGGENYLVAKTPETLLVGDLQVWTLFSAHKI
jgi:hypothetical protein